MPGERPLRGTGMSRPPAMPERPYLWRGTPGWNPADLGPMVPEGGYRPRRNAQAAQALMAERLELFTRLRGEGVAVADAGAIAGVGRHRARRYEQMRRQAEAGAEGAGQ